MARSPKIGRNDTCWCNSGKKYKHCHLDRETQEPFPSTALRNISRQQFFKKECLHPQAAKAHCNGIVDAHTVQRARTLQSLVDSGNHVLTFYPAESDADGLLKVQRRGWRKASTFTGFCGNHDSMTFAPLENEAFKFTTESAFLLSYRALCHELYQKQGAKRSLQQLASLIDRGTSHSEQREIQRRKDIALSGYQNATTNLTLQKQLADEDVLARKYSNWHFVCLEFHGSLCIATSGAPTPNKDLDGNQLQVLHDLNGPLEHLYCSIVACPAGAAVVFGWRKGFSAPEQMVQSFLKLPEEMLPTYLVQYVFAHIENVCFSQSWWDSLNPHLQSQIRILASIDNPYYNIPIYLTESLVPWRLSSVQQYCGA